MFDFFKLLDSTRKRKFFLMAVFIFLGMILDIFSLALLVPLIEIIIDENFNSYTLKILDFLDKYSKGGILLSFSFFIISVFILKSLYSVYLTYRQNRFISNLIRDTSNRLFSFYIEQDFKFYVNINSAEVVRSLNNDLHQFSLYLRSILFFITELGFVLSTVALLIFLNPIISIGTIIFFGLMIFVYYKILKQKLNKLGFKKQQVGLTYNKSILETMNSIKEIKVNKKEEFFKNSLATNTNILWSIDAVYNTYNQAPRYILELISIVAIFIMIFFLSFSDVGGGAISFLGVFVASVFKILPSANKILNSLQNLKFSNSVIETILKKVNTSKKTLPKFTRIKKFNELKLSNITFGYSNTILLNNINLKIKKGDFIGIKGESGTGKTTLIDIILGLQKPQKGSLTINGKENIEFIKGYLPQNCYILDESIRDNVAFGVSKKDQDLKRILDSIKKAELHDFVVKKQEGIDFIVGETGARLSGGQKQRLGLARALYNDPDIIILDEPTSALDSKTEASILQTLQKLSKWVSIILISHNESLLKGCNQVYKLENKKLSLC